MEQPRNASNEALQELLKRDGSLKVATKLSKTNFRIWSLNMENMLMVYDLWAYVGESTAPADYDEDAGRRKRMVAMHAITKNISDERTTLILDANGDPRRCWNLLREDALGETGQDVARLTQRLETLRPESHTLEGLEAYFENMLEANRDLKLIGSGRAKSDADLALRILLNLPAELEDLVTHFLRGPEADLTPSRVKKDVLATMRRRQMRDSLESRSDSAALNTNTTPFRGTCFNCNKVGHKANLCPMPKTQNGGNNGQRRRRRGGRGNGGNSDGDATANCAIALTTTTTDRGQSSLMRRSEKTVRFADDFICDKEEKQADAFAIALPSCTTGSVKQGPRHMILDGGAQCGHVFTHRELFDDDTFSEVTNGQAIIGFGTKDRTLMPTVKGVGTVRVRLASGRMIALQHAKYVPDGTANLISVLQALKTLATNGDPEAEYILTARSAKIVSKDKVILTGSVSAGLVYLDVAATQDFC